MNKVILMGRLTRDPELRYTQSGQAICRYTLAVNRSYKREGEQEVDFINITAFAQRGEFAGKYFRKGMQIAVVGELQNSSYEKDGKKVHSTAVIVSEQYFAESKTGTEGAGKTVNKQQAPQQGYMPPQGYPPQQSYPPVQNNPQQPYPPQGYAPQQGYPQQQGFRMQPNMQMPDQGFVPVEPDEHDADLPF